MRLIDADELREQCDDPFWCVWLGDIDNAPTIDAVPVVRCKDCKHSCMDNLFGDRWCQLLGSIRVVKEDDYCSRGERKDDGT